MTDWYLEGYADRDDVLQRLPLTAFPVLVGRQTGLALASASPNMSRYHAELVDRGGRLFVRDLGSKNGTYVNRERIEFERALQPGDILHFADAEFRLGRTSGSDDEANTATGAFLAESLPNQLPAGTRELAQLFERRAITAVFQPIVRLVDGHAVALECLARGELEGLPRAPSDLFRLAASVGQEVELSELMRERGAEMAAEAGFAGPMFINIHPREVTADRDRLLGHLERLRGRYPELHFVLELHEAAVTDLGAVGELDRGLRALGVDLAYDDFGAGRARLMELAAEPPRYLKFDISMIRKIDQAQNGHRRMVGLLVSFAREMDIVTLAEGITRAEEADVCEALGFELGQGYLFGHPGRLDARGEYVPDPRERTHAEDRSDVETTGEDRIEDEPFRGG